MGMAASQARFLSLVARRSNVQFEGQQINQQRTTLGNKTAEYYNQLLALSVPVPPSVEDYTKSKYSATVGEVTYNLGTITPNPNSSVTGYEYLVSMEKVTKDGDYVAYNNMKAYSAHKSTEQGKNYIITTAGNAEVSEVAYSQLTNSNEDQLLKRTLDQIFEDFPQLDPRNLENMSTSFDNLITNNQTLEDYTDADWNDLNSHFPGLKIGTIANPGEDMQKIKDLFTSYSALPTTEQNKAGLQTLISALPDTEENKNLKCISDDTFHYYTLNNQTYFATDTEWNNEENFGQYGQLQLYYAQTADLKEQETVQANLVTDPNTGLYSQILIKDEGNFSLDFATEKDENAYDEAFNQYEYQKYEYDATVQDINAKTEIIQQQDRTLEVRLKQLETENNAINTEMDAVKKVIDKNIDSSFKTFNS